VTAPVAERHDWATDMGLSAEDIEPLTTAHLSAAEIWLASASERLPPFSAVRYRGPTVGWSPHSGLVGRVDTGPVLLPCGNPGEYKRERPMALVRFADDLGGIYCETDRLDALVSGARVSRDIADGDVQRGQLVTGNVVARKLYGCGDLELHALVSWDDVETLGDALDGARAWEPLRLLAFEGRS